MAFRDINFGSDDAKGDQRLWDYFVRIPEYEKVRAGKAFLVIGRKGTGKTAICQMLHREAQERPDRFAVLLSFKNSPSVDLFASADANFLAPNEYISIWKFLIALEAAKLLLRDESIDGTIRAALDEFLRSNFGNIDVASLDAVTTLRQKEWKVGVELFELPLLKLPQAVVARKQSDAANQRVHFGRAAYTLLKRLSEIQSSNEFLLLFDELDEDYSTDVRYRHLIISLIKAAYQVRQEFAASVHLRPVVVLREDIFAQLDDHDLNKLDDWTVRLRWTNMPSGSTEFSLRELVNERIRVHLGLEKPQDLWSTVVDEGIWGGPGATAWGYIGNRTMDRPRDVIKSLKCCQPFEEHEKLSPDAIRASSLDYSQWLYNEIGNEMYRELPQYRDALGLLTRIGKGQFALHEWRSEYGKQQSLNTLYSAESVLETLFRFGAIGMIKQERWLFKYKMQQVTFDIGASFIVHYGLQKYLVLLGPQPRARSRRR